MAYSTRTKRLSSTILQFPFQNNYTFYRKYSNYAFSSISIPRTIRLSPIQLITPSLSLPTSLINPILFSSYHTSTTLNDTTIAESMNDTNNHDIKNISTSSRKSRNRKSSKRSSLDISVQDIPLSTTSTMASTTSNNHSIEEENLANEIGELTPSDNEHFDPASDSDEDLEDYDQNESNNNSYGGILKSLNPYLPMSRNYYKSASNPPPKLISGIETVLRGRNIAALNSHWTDMSSSLKERNVSLLHDVQKLEKLRLAIANKVIKEDEINLQSVNTDSPPLIYGPMETLAYVLHGLLPSYGIALRLLTDYQNSLSSNIVKPTSMLDFGSGPGSAILAAHQLWKDSLFDIIAVEPSRSMTQVAEHLLADIPGIMYRKNLDEVFRYHKGKRFDIITVHGVLGQLTSDNERDKVLADLWDLLNPGGAIILCEHGDRWGFHVIKRSRDLLLHRATALAKFLPQLISDNPPDRQIRGKIGKLTLLDSDNGLELENTDEHDNQLKLQRYTLRKENNNETIEEDDDNDNEMTLQLENKYKAQQPSTNKRNKNILQTIEHDFDDNPSNSNTISSRLTLSSSSSSKNSTLLSSIPSSVNNLITKKDNIGSSNLPSVGETKRMLREYGLKNGLVDRMLRPPADIYGTAVVGPCAHALSCPMAQNSWCHFAQAVHRHRKAGRSVHTRGLPRR